MSILQLMHLGPVLELLTGASVALGEIFSITALLLALNLLAKAVRFIVWFKDFVYMAGLWTGYIFKRVLPPLADAISLLISSIDWEQVGQTLRTALVVTISFTIAAAQVSARFITRILLTAACSPVEMPLAVVSRQVRRHGRLVAQPLFVPSI